MTEEKWIVTPDDPSSPRRERVVAVKPYDVTLYVVIGPTTCIVVDEFNTYDTAQEAGKAQIKDNNRRIDSLKSRNTIIKEWLRELDEERV